MDAFDPFLTFFREHPDFGHSDARRECENLLVRDQLIEELVRGETDWETTADCLAEQGIDPLIWQDSVVSHIEYVIDNGTRFLSNERGILLPETYFQENQL